MPTRRRGNSTDVVDEAPDVIIQENGWDMDDITDTLLGRKESSFWNNRRIWFLIWVQVFAFVELYSYLLPLALGSYWDEAVHFHLKLTISTFLSTLSIDLVSMEPVT
ncbi:hypothetical protein TrRE_jg12516, partial [Triparma retinervis]